MAKARRPTLGAFGERKVPIIACFNKAVTPLGVDFDSLIRALQTFVDQHVAPVWGTRAKLIKSTDFVKGAWAVVFLEDADHAGSLGYHDLTPDGLPESKVFVRTTLANGELVSVAASHELVEMLVDPAGNMMTTGPDRAATYAYESADPVEETHFQVDGIPMSNFVHPAYFQTFHQRGTVSFDHLGKVRKPFQPHSGGYQIVFKNGKWRHAFGSASKAKRFAREDRRGHRSEQRHRSRTSRLKRSDTRASSRRKRPA